MRQREILIGLFLSILLITCKDQKKSVSQDHIEVIDTQMAELKKELPTAIKDSIRFLNFWNRFRELLMKNDTNEIIKLSLKSVYCPVYQKKFNYYPDNKLVPLYFFLHAPHRDNYIAAFSSYISKDTPQISAVKLDSQEIIDLGFKNNKEVNIYTLSFYTKEIIENYIVHRDHSFEFIKTNNSFKFMGLKVFELGSQYQYKLIPFDSLYFPLYKKAQNSLANFNSLDTSLNHFYSKYLLQFKEPNLYINNSGDEIYRFTWIRSFHNPIAIRFQKHNNSYILYTKEMVNNGGYILQEIKVNTEEKLTAYEWNNFKEKIDRLNFWNVPANDPNPESHDGAQWILEARVKNNYHFAERNMPEDNNYRACCKYLLSLTKLKIPEKDQY
jgi:hypothetical protein